jgi:hypothetical protein
VKDAEEALRRAVPPISAAAAASPTPVTKAD